MRKYILFFIFLLIVFFAKPQVEAGISQAIWWYCSSGGSGYPYKLVAGTNLTFAHSGGITTLNAGTGASTAWDDIGNPDASDEIDFAAYTIELNVADFQIGDGAGTNYIGFDGTPTMTFHGTADINLPDNSVDSGDVNFNYAGSASEGGAATTATALAVNGNNCAAGSVCAGVDASGVAEGCVDVWTEAENTSAGYTSVTVSDTAYDATTWDTNTDAATKNSIRDRLEVLNTAIGLNTAKNTNVSTALSAGTVNATTYGITSDGGADDIILPEADTTNAGLLGSDKWDEIVANSVHSADNSQAHSDYLVNNGNDDTSGSLQAKGAGGFIAGEDVAGGTPNVAGVLKLFSAGDNAYYTTFTAGTQTQNNAFTLPLNDGDANQQLQTDGAGVLSWAAGGGVVNTANIADVNVTQTELAELETIGATTISANQWATLGGIAETLTNTELNLLDGITVLSGSNTGDDSGTDDQTAAEVSIADAGSIITATDAEDALQENRTAIDLNTAKTTNATHTGEVTGATALTIAPDAVTYDKMQDTSDTDKLLGRSTAGGGTVEEIACTSAGRALIDDADAATQRTTLGVQPTASPTFTGTVGAPTINLTGGQIAFPATAVPSANANTLDDYEEGTWTAAFAATTSGTITINESYNTGRYTKTGRLVMIQGRFQVTSVSSPVGDLQITGLPFTACSGGSCANAVSIHASALEATAITALQGFIDASTTILYIRRFEAGGQPAVAASVKADSIFFITTSHTI